MADLRQFRQFIAVAEELHFRRAAARLHMAQPPLTASIRGLEQELGTRLLERGNRVIRLTEAGAAFLEGARRAVNEAEHAMDTARRAGRGLSGRLRIAFVGSVSGNYLPRLLRCYRHSHPCVELELREATTSRQIADLLAGRADLGFLIPPLRGADGLTVEPMRRERLIAVLPADHPLSVLPKLTLSALADEPFVLWPASEGPGFHALVLIACAKAGFTPRVVQEAHQMSTIVALVAAGIGVSIVPTAMRDTPRADAIYREIENAESMLSYDIAGCWRTGDASPALRGFLDVARREPIDVPLQGTAWHKTGEFSAIPRYTAPT